MAVYTIENGYQKNNHRPLIVLAGLVFILAAALIGYSQIKPNSSSLASNITSQVNALPKQQRKLITPLPWPQYGQAAYGVVDEGVLAESTDNEQAVPIASLAKVITALAILKEKPLSVGDQGPTITLTKQDEKLFQKYIAMNGTVVAVQAGEKITEYQALQATLMMSANNMADSLAIWAFGSVENYNNYANNMLRQNNLFETTVADATGFSPDTQSTASEMVELGILYLKNPVLRKIAAQPGASVPFAGQIDNYNSTINKDGIIGLKIGYTDEAGRSFLVADIRNNDVDEASVVAVIGADSLSLAMKDAAKILKSGNHSHDLLPKKS